MSIRSKKACEFTIKDMAEMFPQLYLWTFTFAELLGIREAAKRWSRFVSHPHRGFTVSYPHCSGDRVFEMHPGKKLDDGVYASHGLHIHCVLNARLDVNNVRSKWEHFAGENSRLHVKAITKGQECYVAKYLGKNRIECMGGMRLWAPIGHCDAHKCSDIIIDTRWTAIYAFLSACIAGFAKLRWIERIMITNKVLLGESVAGMMNHKMEQDDEAKHLREVTWLEILNGVESIQEGDEKWTSDNPVRRERLRKLEEQRE